MALLFKTESTNWVAVPYMQFCHLFREKGMEVMTENQEMMTESHTARVFNYRNAHTVVNVSAYRTVK